MLCATILTVILCAAVHESYSYPDSLDGLSRTAEKGERRKRQQNDIQLPVDFGASGENYVIFSKQRFDSLVSCFCSRDILYCTVRVDQGSAVSVDPTTNAGSMCDYYDSETFSAVQGYSTLRFTCRSKSLNPPFDLSGESSCMVLDTIHGQCPSGDMKVYTGPEKHLEIDTIQSGTITVKLCNKANDITVIGGGTTRYSTSTTAHGSVHPTGYGTSTTTHLSDSTMTSISPPALNTNQTQTTAQADPYGEENTVRIIIGVVVTAVVLIIILVVVLIIWRRKKRSDSATAKNNSNASITRSNDCGHLFKHSNGPSDVHSRYVYSGPNEDQIIGLNTTDGYTYAAPKGKMTNEYTIVSPGTVCNVESDPQYSQAGEVTSATKNVYARLHENMKDTRNPYDMLTSPQKEPSNPGASPSKTPEGRVVTGDVLLKVPGFHDKTAAAKNDTKTTDDVSQLYATVVKGNKPKN